MENNNLDKHLLKYVIDSFPDFINDLYEENPKLFPYLDCTNAFFKKLYDDYGIKFDPSIIDPNLADHIDYEIYTNACPDEKPKFR